MLALPIAAATSFLKTSPYTYNRKKVIYLAYGKVASRYTLKSKWFTVVNKVQEKS